MHDHSHSHSWEEDMKSSPLDRKENCLPFLIPSWTWDVTGIRKLDNNWQVNKTAYIVIVIIDSVDSIWWPQAVKNACVKSHKTWGQVDSECAYIILVPW